MAIKEKELTAKFKEILAETKEKFKEILKEPKEKLEEFIKYLDNLEIDTEKDNKDLIQQIEEFELVTYYTFIYEDENGAKLSTDGSEIEIYLAEDVDEKIKLYEELIQEMKCCENCDYNYNVIATSNCKNEDPCYYPDYKSWKLKK